mgnify:CR=1 FL=1
MTIQQVIDRLQVLHKKHGDIEVCFDAEGRFDGVSVDVPRG